MASAAGMGQDLDARSFVIFFMARDFAPHCVVVFRLSVKLTDQTSAQLDSFDAYAADGTIRLRFYFCGGVIERN
jgi:hypothetical protein